MEFRLLGAVEARVDGQMVDLGRRRVRALLAVLLSEVGQPVSSERLIELLFADHPQQDPRKALQIHVSRLRRALAPGGDGVRLESNAGSYVLHAEPASVDAYRFENLVADARGIEDPAERSAMLRDALALWHGPALGDLAPDLIGHVRDRLEEARLEALELRVDADLAFGRCGELIAELADLTRLHPTREHLVASRMLALYRSGRQVDALDVYGSLALRLRDELGIDPSRELRALHESILREDPALAQPNGFVTTTRLPPRPAQLPTDLATFTGRSAELAALEAQFGRRPEAGVCAIDGMAGVGKTVLAAHAAHRVAQDYPDGQLCLDLFGSTQGIDPLDASEALARLLRSLGVPGTGIPVGADERAGLYRSVIADQRVLILLDNAADSEQVRPLLPAAPGCLTLITSRHRLTNLDHAETMTLEVVSRVDAVRLFETASGHGAGPEADSVIDRIVDLCGRLPLAIRIAAARLRSRPAWTPEHLLERLMVDAKGLAELEIGERSVSGAFQLSYEHLDGDQRRLFRLLALHPGLDIDTRAAAALYSASLDTTEPLLEGLLDAHLLEQYTPGRYRLHDLVRVFAADCASNDETDESRHRALTRMYDWYLHAADNAVGIVEPTRPAVGGASSQVETPLPALADYDAAIDWLDAECHDLVAATRAAASGWQRHAWQLARTLHRYFYVRGHSEDWITTNRLALTATRDIGEARGEAETLNNLGMAYVRTGRFVDALEHLEQALSLSRSNGDRRGEARTLNNLGIASYHSGHSSEAIDHLDAALALWRELGDELGGARALNNLGKTYERMGHNAEALDLLQQASAIRHRLGDEVGIASTLVGLGNLYAREHAYDKAIECLYRALETERAIGHRDGQANAYLAIGRVNQQLRRYDEASTSYESAMELARILGHRSFEAEALNGLGEIARAAGDADVALRRHRTALELVAHTGARLEQAHAYDGIGRALIDAGDESGAERHLATARTLYAKIGVPEDEHPAYVPDDA